MSLATTCPQCKTSFKVVPDQLKLRRGLVRCGVCQHVFSGIDSLRYVDERPVAPAPPPDDDEVFDAAHDSPFGQDDEPPDTEFFEPATATAGDHAFADRPDDAFADRPDHAFADRPDDAFADRPDDTVEAAFDGAGDAPGRFVDAPASADAGRDKAGFEPSGAIAAFDPGFTAAPPAASADDSAAPPAHASDTGGPAGDSPGSVLREHDDAEVEHYDITAARGWPQEDADLLDETAGSPDEPSDARDGGPPAAVAASSAVSADEFTVFGAGHGGGLPTGANATAGPTAGGAAAGPLAAAAVASGAAGRAAAGSDAEQDAIDFFAPQRRVRGFSSRSAPLQWLAACLLAVVLVVQLLIGARHWLAARAPDLEPLLAAAAGAVGLTVDPPRELDALTIESFELQASGVDRLFALVAHLRNRADHVVHWPAMELALTDSAGTLVARKVLMPSDYLGAGTKSPLPAGIGPGAEVPVRVALEVPGLSPSGYTVNIFYP